MGRLWEVLPTLTLQAGQVKTQPSQLEFSQPCPLLCPPRPHSTTSCPLGCQGRWLGWNLRGTKFLSLHMKSWRSHEPRTSQAPPVSLWRNSRHSKLDNGEFHKGHFFKGILCQVASNPSRLWHLGNSNEFTRKVREALRPSRNKRSVSCSLDAEISACVYRSCPIEQYIGICFHNNGNVFYSHYPMAPATCGS